MPRDSITLSSPTIIFPRNSHSYQTVGNMPLSVLVDPGATKSVLMIKASYDLCLLEEIKKAPRAGFPTATGPCPPETQLVCTECSITRERFAKGDSCLRTAYAATRTT